MLTSPAPKLPSFGRPQSLRAKVTDALRLAVISGEMVPGRLYSAPMLATQLGVSSTPVREAMLDLVKEGLVEAIRNKGFLVTNLSQDDRAELTELRCLIEVPTIGKIARTASTASVEALRPLAEAIIEVADESNFTEFVQLDRQFHLDLLALAGNRFLVDCVGEMRSRSRLAFLREGQDMSLLTRAAREHIQLIDLLVARDAGRAEALIREHIVGHIDGAPTPV